MTRLEHLLTILVEECGETAQRATKALRFGINEVQEGQDLDNSQRMTYEFNDIVAMMEMLQDEGWVETVIDRKAIEKKKIRVEKFLNLSREQGTLQPTLQQLLEHPLTPEDCVPIYTCDRCIGKHKVHEKEVLEMQVYESPHGCMGGDTYHHSHYFFYCDCGRPIEVNLKDIPDKAFIDMTKINREHGRGRCTDNIIKK